MAGTPTRFDLDLDTLSSEVKRVKFNNKTIEIYPPQLDEVLGLQQMAREFQGLDTENLTDEQIVEVFDKLKSSFSRLIPGLDAAMRESRVKVFLRRFFPSWKALAEHKALNVQQLFALLELVISMATPEDVKELTKRNISVESNGEKKMVSNR